MAEGAKDAALKLKPRRRAPRRLRRWLVRGALALCLLAAAIGKPGPLWSAELIVGEEKPAARFVLPEPTGRYAVGTTEMHLVDRDRPDPWVEDRPRELMVSVWYPAWDGGGSSLSPYMRPRAAAHFEQTSLGAVGLTPEQVDLEGVRSHAFSGAPVKVSQGPWPVVLYSPGGGLPRTMGTVLVEGLASHGYVVVTVDHTYEASEVEFPEGRVEVAKPPEEAGLEELVSVRVSDVRHVLDQLEEIRDGGNPDAEGRRLPEGLGRALDLSKVGMFGHSAGGFTAAEAMLEDRRIDAGINLDGSMGYDLDEGDFGEAAERGLDRPFMLVGAGTSGPDDLPHTHRDAQDWGAFWEHSTGPKLDLHVPDGEHFTFTDYQALLPQLSRELGVPNGVFVGMIGTVDPQRIVASQRAYVVAFFDRYLRGEARELLEGPSPDHPDVEFVR